MKKHFLPVALVASAILCATAGVGKDDPTVMTVAGTPVSRSEFEYLYNKNNRQQEQPQSMEEYADMFVVYKLKVADAEAAGIDTTASFLKELDGYCADLEAPFLVDTVLREQLVDEAWARMQTMRDVSHIMLPLGITEELKAQHRERLDSIRNLILNGADFADLARRFSSDRSAMSNGGHMGYAASGQLPYKFEQAAWAVPVGAISEVVEDAPFGYHIIKVNEEKPHPGMVKARHILKLTQGLSPEEKAVKKAQIDSIFTLITNGGNFASIAMKESEDPGSARNGGDLGKFGPGQMVREFETQAFGLPDGGISYPFETAYGYHIVQTLEHLPLGTLDDNRNSIYNAMARDERINMPRNKRMGELQAKWGIAKNEQGIEAVKESLAGKRGSEAFGLVDGSTVVITYPGGTVTAAEVIDAIPAPTRENAPNPWGAFERQLAQSLEDVTVSRGRIEFAKEDPDFRNLVNEYRDGILLFEISNRKVWDRASNDTLAQRKMFEANRASYTWDKPRFKGVVVLATSDSVAAAAKDLLAREKVANDSLVKTLRGAFGQNIKVERVLTAKGDNAIVDEIAFGGPKADPVGKWAAWFPYDSKVIDAPEEAADVKAAVTTDLQQQLEAEWVKDLHKKYKVKVDKKLLRRMSEEQK